MTMTIVNNKLITKLMTIRSNCPIRYNCHCLWQLECHDSHLLFCTDSFSRNYIFYTRRNLFGISSNQTQIRLYLPFSDWFGTTTGHCPFAVPNHSKNGKYNLISVYLIRFRNNFFVCTTSTFLQRHLLWPKWPGLFWTFSCAGLYAFCCCFSYI